MKIRPILSRWLLVVIFIFITTATVLADQGTYIVQPGDTLSSIAQQYGVTVQAIVAANNLANPNFITVGQELIIPDPTSASSPAITPRPTATGAAAGPSTTYTVQSGDSLFKIAIQFGVTVQAIVDANGLANANFIVVGQELIIPGGTGGNNSGSGSAAAVPAATPVPAAPTSPNLFTNGSFEGGRYDHNGVQELQVPQGWFMYVDEGENTLVPGSGGLFFRPESRIFADVNIPESEHATFIWNGTHAIKVFKGGAPTHFGLFTDVYLQPGTYRATFNFYPDAVLAYEGSSKTWATDPLAAEYRIIHGTGGTAWTPAAIGTKNTITYTVTVTSAGAVRLGVAFRNRFVLANNGWVIDDWSLVKVN